MKAAASSQVSTCLPSISDLKHVPVITMTGSGSAPRMADHRSQPTRGKSVAFHVLELLEHFSIRLGVSRVREISVAFFFGNTFEKRGDCSPKLLNGARLHFA